MLHINNGWFCRSKTTTKYFDDLKKLKLVLNEWFNDNEIYNALGYLFFTKKKKIVGSDQRFFDPEEKEKKERLKKQKQRMMKVVK